MAAVIPTRKIRGGTVIGLEAEKPVKAEPVKAESVETETPKAAPKKGGKSKKN